MKKVLLIIALLVSVNFMYAQTTYATLSLPDVEVTTPGEFLVPYELTYCSPGDLIVGIQFSMLYDNTKVEWMGTSANPAAGIVPGSINPAMTPLGGDWLWNANFPGNLIFSWIDPTYNGVTIASPSDIIVFRFQYLGGLAPGESTPLEFSLTAKMANGQNVKIINELTNQYFDVYQLTLNNGSVSMPGGSVGKIWTGGGGDLDWFNPANWAPPGVPTSSDDVTIPATKAPMVVIAGGPASTGALTVAFGAGIQIDPTGSLTTNGTYTNDGDLIITSDFAGNSGSFIDNGLLQGTGNFSFQRNMGATFPDASFNGWHLISSPVAGFSTNDIFDYYMEWYNEPISQYVHVEGTVPCVPAYKFPTPMEGWAVKFSQNYGGPPYNCPGGTGTTIEFNGPFLNLYTGILTSPVLASGPDPNHWNLIGNPYPSAVDANLLGWMSSIQTFSGLSYLPWAGGVGFNVIAPTQGFFVNTAVATAFTVSNGNRIHGGVFQKADVADVLELQVSGNGHSDYSFIRFLEEATEGKDQVWDAPKLMSNVPEMPQIYTTSGSNEFSIDARPATPLVHMSFVCGVAGNYTIEAIETSEFQNVVLEDGITGQQTDLLAGSYTFSYSEVGEVHPFIVHFTPLGTPELNANNINIWSANQTIYVQAPATTGDIVVYNMMGQVVVKTAIQPGINEIPMNDVNTYYIVKVLGNEVTETGKVFIK